MPSYHRFRLKTLVVGGLLIALFSMQVTGKPITWMQAALLDVLKIRLGTGAPDTEFLQIVKSVRPATKGESPDEAEIKKLPPAIPQGQIRRPSKTELLDKCAKTPQCKAKLQKAQQRGPNKPLPAAREENPDEKEMKNLPKAVPPRGPRQPSSSGLLMPGEHQTLLAWLNPFQVTSAYAQSPVSIYLTPGAPYHSSNSFLNLFGAAVYYNGRYILSSYHCGNHSQSEGNPLAYFRVRIPSTGTYMINMQATNGKAKFRHQYNGPIIDTWDFTTQPYGTYDYLTAEYLEQGDHWFYFWPDEGSAFYFYSVSVESYP